jgi:hypothetical protein
MAKVLTFDEARRIAVNFGVDLVGFARENFIVVVASL